MLKIDDIKKRFKSFYHKPAVFITFNVSGIVISIIGIIVCIAMVGGAFEVNNRTRTEVKNAETIVYRQLDRADDALDMLDQKIDSFTAADVIAAEVKKVTSTNIDRLETLQDTLKMLNFGNRLDGPIAKVAIVVKNLKVIDHYAGNVDEVKDLLHQRIDILRDRIDEVRSQIRDGANTIRNTVLYAATVTWILAIIFFLGEYTLIRRCIIGLRTRKMLTAPA